ncbi:YfhH family protein [Paenibacillus sp. TRM 82003]|nr:YfhH family protein [Paenibacillus sp. TRM 82003]
MKRFSEMSAAELTEEIKRLAGAIEKSGAEGERDVLRQKWLLARSYLVRLSVTFAPGTYRVEGEERKFTLAYVNGVMGWGTWPDGEEGAVPLAALQAEA